MKKIEFTKDLIVIIAAIVGLITSIIALWSNTVTKNNLTKTNSEFSSFKTTTEQGMSKTNSDLNNFKENTTNQFKALSERRLGLALPHAQLVQDDFTNNDQFIVSGDEVYDRKTDKTWKRCNYGQSWDSENNWCKGIPKRLNIDEAILEIANLKSNWRLPDLGELERIMAVGCVSKKEKESTSEIFPEIQKRTYYLTTTTNGDSHIMAVECFGLSTTSVGVGKKMISAVRLVREGK